MAVWLFISPLNIYMHRKCEVPAEAVDLQPGTILFTARNSESSPSKTPAVQSTHRRAYTHEYICSSIEI